MKVLKHAGQWISYKIDSIAKLFITKEDLMNLSLDEQKENISAIRESIVGIRTARKNLETAKKENIKKLADKELKVKYFVKKGKDENAKIELKSKLEIQKQNEWLDESVVKMKTKEDLLKLKIEKLEQFYEISKNNVEFYTHVHRASQANLNSIDISNDRVNLNDVMSEMKSEIQTMDNRIEALDELEDEGVIKRDGVSLASDYEVEEELEKYKKKK